MVAAHIVRDRHLKEISFLRSFLCAYIKIYCTSIYMAAGATLLYYYMRGILALDKPWIAYGAMWIFELCKVEIKIGCQSSLYRYGIRKRRPRSKEYKKRNLLALIFILIITTTFNSTL